VNVKALPRIPKSNDHFHSPRSSDVNDRLLDEILVGKARQRIPPTVQQRDFFSSHNMWLRCIPECPSFEPTLEEFIPFEKYLKTLAPALKLYGMVKVHAPAGWTPSRSPMPSNGYLRTQCLRSLWQSEGDAGVAGVFSQVDGEVKPMSEQLKALKERAKQTHKLLGVDSSNLNPALMEQLYWWMFEKNAIDTIYAADQAGGMFKCNALKTKKTGEKQVCECGGWGMHCLPQQSLLKYMTQDCPGINTPMLYLASCFSTFPWHVEDMYLSAINYEHYGTTRTWYGVPGKHVDDFYKAARQIELAEGKITNKSVGLKNTMFSPAILVQQGVPVSRSVQGPRDFMITDAAAHHCGFSHGFAVCEAVNLATERWIPWATKTAALYKSMQRMAVIPARLFLVQVASDMRKQGRDYPRELRRMLIEVAQEEKRLRSRWNEIDGVEFKEILQAFEAYIYDTCDICREHLWPSYVQCQCDDDNRFCMRHTEYELLSKHGCKLEKHKWVVSTFCPDKTMQLLIDET